MFIKEGNTNQADFEENLCRATACEMIARRITHMVSRHRLPSVMSTRFRYIEPDGDISPALSALESAIDQNCTVSRLVTDELTLDLPQLKRGADRRSVSLEGRVGPAQQRGRRH